MASEKEKKPQNQMDLGSDFYFLPLSAGFVRGFLGFPTCFGREELPAGVGLRAEEDERPPRLRREELPPAWSLLPLAGTHAGTGLGTSLGRTRRSTRLVPRVASASLLGRDAGCW